MAIVDELIAVLGYDLRGEGDLRRWRAGMLAAEGTLNSLAATARRAGMLIGTYIGGRALKDFTMSVVNTGKQFEAYDIQLETLLGSQEKAKDALSWIKQFARDTPLEMADVVDSFVQLTNVGIDPTNGTLLALVDAMSASGKGVQQLERLTLALTQAWSKEKLQGGEILQLVEANIPVWTMLAEATGKSVKELQDLSSAGKLGRKEIQLLIDAIGKKYVGASARFARSLEGIQSNLAENWTEFLKRIAGAGFYEEVKTRLQGLLDLTTRWLSDGTADRWAKRISDAFISVMDAVNAVVDRIATHGAFIVEFLQSLDPSTVYALGAAFGLLLIRLFPATWAFVAFVAALEDFLTYLGGGESKFGQFIEWIQEMTGASEALATALAAVVAALGLMMVMKPFSVLKGIGRFLTGFGAGAAGEIAAGAGKSRSGGLLPFFLRGAGLAAAGIAAGAYGINEGGAYLKDRYGETMIRPPEKNTPLDHLNRASGGKLTGQPVLPPRDIRSEAETTNDPEAGRMPGSSIASILVGMDNLKANLAKMATGASAGAVITDSSQDNRDQSVTVSTTINQTVNEAQAPGAAAAAVGSAVGSAATNAASRLVPGPQL